MVHNMKLSEIVGDKNRVTVNKWVGRLWERCATVPFPEDLSGRQIVLPSIGIGANQAFVEFKVAQTLDMAFHSIQAMRPDPSRKLSMTWHYLYTLLGATYFYLIVPVALPWCVATG